MSDDLDLSQPIRDGLLADDVIVAALPAYNSGGGVTIFTRRPVPSDAPYPMIVISPDIMVSEADGIDDDQPIVVRDIAVYGKNEPAASYRLVEEIAYAVRHVFHRQRHSLFVTGEYDVIDVRVSGPRSAPTDDQQTVGRLVELTVRLSRKL